MIYFNKRKPFNLSRMGQSPPSPPKKCQIILKQAIWLLKVISVMIRRLDSKSMTRRKHKHFLQCSLLRKPRDKLLRSFYLPISSTSVICIRNVPSLRNRWHDSQPILPAAHYLQIEDVVAFRPGVDPKGNRCSRQCE